MRPFAFSPPIPDNSRQNAPLSAAGFTARNDNDNTPKEKAS
jgi:hypothetical protein